MKQTKLFFVMMLMLVMSNAFTSCQKDVVVLQEIQEQETLDNPALVTKLKALGFTFDGDALVIDDKVQNTTSLDLSGAKLTSAEGLEVFPKLEKINLSNNSLTNTFDFAKLPETVKSVNLAGNDLFQFKGLATVTDDGFTLQRELTELTLPASARFNVDLLPFYYNETKGKTTLKMQNPTNNQIEPYTTLRNIPDENLRNYIKQKFPSIMKGEQVDLLAKFSATESNIGIKFYKSAKISNMEGIQYIVNNPNWEALGLYIDSATHLKIPYLKINKKLQILGLFNSDTPYLDLSQGEALRFIVFTNNSSIKILDLSASKIFMKQEKLVQLNSYNRHSIALVGCSNLEDIKLAEDVTTQYLYELTLVDLPKLKQYDMSKLEGIENLGLGMLPNTELTLPKKLSYNIDNNDSFNISITKDMETNTQIKDFIMKYGNPPLKLLNFSSWDFIKTYSFNNKIKAFNYQYEWGINQ